MENNLTPTPLQAPFHDAEHTRHIANTIMSQVQKPSRITFFSWGAHSFTCAQSAKCEKYSYNAPILRFKVNGRKFKGYVHVIYNASDYYDIEFVSTHGNLKHRIEDVDCFTLQEKIDEYVF